MPKTNSIPRSVLDIFQGGQYTKGSGIENLEKKLSVVGLNDIEELREKTLYVSNFVYGLVLFVMTALTLVSMSQSITIGYTMGGGGWVSALFATTMGLFQGVLFILGIWIGAIMGNSGDSESMFPWVKALTGLLMVVTISTGIAFNLFAQNGGQGSPLNLLFGSVSGLSQRAFVVFLVVVFECCVVATPILFKVLSCPMRETWEARKKIKAYTTAEKNKMLLTECIATSERLKVERDSQMFRSIRSTEMSTRANMAADVIQFENRMINMWMKRKGLGSWLKFKFTGKHDTPQEFIKMITVKATKEAPSIEKKGGNLWE